MSGFTRRVQAIIGLGICFAICLPYTVAVAQDSLKTKRQDSVRYKIVNPYLPNFHVSDRHGDPFSNYTTSSPFSLKDPKNLKTEISLDTGMHYTISEKMGGIDFRPISTMSFKDYSQQQDRGFQKSYYKGKSLALDGESAVSGRNLLPKLYLSPVLDRIFGGSYVELIPKGFVTLDLGGSFQKIQNPSIPIRQQRNGGLNFNQQINLSVTGKVGAKLKISTNFDTNNSFDFQNTMKVEYSGLKEDLLKKLEIGNVSLPLNNSLIKGAQNLFGVKAQLQFGKLMTTILASTERGKQSTLHVPGSGSNQGRPFQITASNYDDNRNFFLAQFFRDNFQKWVSSVPGQISSGINITRLEVYSVNRQNDTQTLRDIVALMDMGESDKIYRKDVFRQTSASLAPASNGNNNLFAELNRVGAAGGITAVKIDSLLKGSSFGKGLVLGTDFETVTSARKLATTEYSFNAQLGYLTLQRKLQNDEALAVAFEYTYNGQVFKVGELTEDYSSRATGDVIFLKMLRPRAINIADVNGTIYPSWNLMMKNIYNLGVTNLQKEGFQLRVVYHDDNSGVDNPQLQEAGIAGSKQLINVVGLDRLDPYNDPVVNGDGNFDFLEGITINSANGLIIIPYVAPFNDPFVALFNQEPNLDRRAYLLNKYPYDTLYHTTEAQAVLVSSKNKFFLTGSFKAGSGRDIIIQGFNITPGSVKVYAGSTPLREGTDYTVDYTFGKVTILNEGILSSGQDLDITYEQQDPFSFQTRSLLGTRLDYKLNANTNIGGTLLYYNERPLITRVQVGNEPARNFQYGFDFNTKKNSRVLTKLVDALPFLQTKEVSNYTINAEVAQLFPGTSNKIGGKGTSFVDDFENAATPYNLVSTPAWKLASVPNADSRFDLSNGNQNDLRAGYKRAKLSWFQVDNIFYTTGVNYGPPNINLSNHYTRPVLPQEIFPYFNNYIGNFYQPILNFAYYPSERGQYNYNPELDNNGKLLNPASNWGGVTTAIRTNTDFDAANIEYIEFWMMDPFIQDKNGIVDDGSPNATYNNTGGQLIFHLGSVSEDLGRDGYQSFENGLPVDGNLQGGGVYTNSAWGYVTNTQYLNNAFSSSTTARQYQDVGLDGLNSEKEATDPKFQNFLTTVTPSALPLVTKDPSADDFQYYLGPDYDAEKAQILQRYKNFNGMENNSPVVSGGAAYSASGTTIPDNEDLNGDNTLTNLEQYYTYTTTLKPGLTSGQKYIVDQISNPMTLGGVTDNVTWYLFRIPIRNFDTKVGNITDFKTIKYLRMLLTGFTQPVVIRMANFRLVGQKYRQYAGNLQESALTQVIEPNLDNFSVSTVNVEENGKGDATKPAYVPPLRRDYDVTSVVRRQLNEQSGQICVTGLADGDARAMYKNVAMDLFNYGRIQMFINVHASDAITNIKDNALIGFLRLGTDQDQNYYEIELPLKVTPNGESSNTVAEVWPDQNQINLALDHLYALKIKRDRENFSRFIPYPLGGAESVGDGKHFIRVMGTPDLSALQVIMIGIRNPRDDGRAYDVCMWADELRVTDFNQTAGWAANLVMSAKLADLGTVTGSYRHIGFGYGDVQSKISARARSNTDQFSISTNLNLDKLLPRNTGLKIPMYFSYQSIMIDPKYDPANPDLKIGAALQSFNLASDRATYLKKIQDITTKKSINFTNVRKTKVRKDAKSHLYDVENFAFTYSYSESQQHNFNLVENTIKNTKGAVAWQYQSKSKGIQPFKNVKFVNSKYLQLIKDFNFNPMPTSISVRGELQRSFTKMTYRNTDPTATNSVPNWQKYFVFNRYYSVNWALTKSLKLDYNATANAIIDEPAGDINTKQKRDSIIGNLKRLGRMKYFEQNVTANYTLPFDKFPATNWIGGEYRYNVGYNWKAGPLQTIDSLKMGNIIQNTRNQGYTGKLDIVKLYNKLGFLKNANTPRPPPPPPPKNAAERLKLAKADTLPHPPELKLVRGLLRLIMSLRSINGTYTVSEGTILPGFTKSPKLFGMDQSWMAPGLNFILGGQDVSIAHNAAARGWITNNKNLTTPFSQNQTKDLSLRANLEPSMDIKIQLDAKKTSNSSFQDLFKDVTGSGDFADLSPSRSGSYKISFISVGTTFRNNGSLNSSVFDQFKANTAIIQQRFKSLSSSSYEVGSQDVLIPAFIAAYSGRSAKSVGLTPFPAIPMPNWRLDYSGLSKLDPFKDIFSSVTLSHAYTSSYSVLNYSNSLLYNSPTQIGLSNSISNYNSTPNFVAYAQDTTSKKLVPIFVISQVLISETFAPLIGINIKTKKKLSVSFNYKTKRDVSLNVPNAQITEVNGKDWSLEVGFTKNNMRLPFRDQGRIITLKNDVTFKMSVSLSSTQTIQRRMDQGSSITNGNINFQFRPNISYMVNKKITVQAYVQRTTNTPLVSNSYFRATTQGGVKLIFNLSQ